MSSSKPRRPQTEGVPRVFVVENDPDVLDRLVSQIRCPHDRVEVIRAVGAVEAFGILKNADDRDERLDAVVIDIGLPGSEETNQVLLGACFDGDDSVGLRLARKFRQLHEKLPIFGCSGQPERWKVSNNWFRENGSPARRVGVYHKYLQFVMLKHHLDESVGLSDPVKVFIVHCVDTPRLEAFKKFALKLGLVPVVLGEEERLNEGWMTLFENSAEESALAWVLYTPDEWSFNTRRPDDQPERRARPNVVLEHGFLFGRFGRDTGRVFVFRCDNTVMPSDVSGLRYIQINTPLTDPQTKQTITDLLLHWLPVSQE